MSDQVDAPLETLPENASREEFQKFTEELKRTLQAKDNENYELKKKLQEKEQEIDYLKKVITVM